MASAISRLFASAAALLLLGLAACSPVPDAETLRATVKARLAAAFAEPVLEIETFRRLGSGPLPQGDDGVERRIVYYNATLRLAADHAFADWEALNAAALAELLGAADRGLEGVRPEGNVRGDLLHVRGSATFAHTPEGWRAAPFAAPPPPTAPPTDNTGPPALARSLIERISALFDDPPGRETEARAIITEELVDAHRKIDLRLERLQRAFVIAGGPGGGEYDLVARSIAAASSAAGIRAVAVATQGSVENVRLLREGSTEAALLQSDVARMAAEGRGFFAGRAPMPGLRALAALFPEPLHVVVRGDGPIHTVADLRGRRVDLGMPGSGSRATALAVLAAHGLAETDLGWAGGAGPVASADALAAGEIDAFLAVINAPARLIQRLSARLPLRLVALDPDALAALTDGEATRLPLTLPTATYTNAPAPVPTMAVTALLAARDDLGNAEVEAILRTTFDRVDFVAAGSAAGALVSRRRALTGLPLPLHPAAEAFFGAAPAD